jgi:hypothetical protein
VPSFRRWRFEMKLSPFFLERLDKKTNITEFRQNLGYLQ